MTEELQRFKLSRFISDNSYGYSGVLNESVTEQLSDTVLDRMFELTIGKYNKIDFSEIERSRGDVTKIKYYKNLEECITTLIDIHQITNKIPSILVVSDALNNLRTMRKEFEYNFRIKNNAAIMIYNTIMYAIMMSTSYIISASISISKEATSKDSVDVKVYEMDSKALSLISALNSFNKSVSDGSLYRFMKEAQNVDVQTESVDVLEEGIKDIVEETKYIYNLIPKDVRNKIKFDNIKNTKGAKIALGIGIGIGTLWLATKIIPFVQIICYQVFRCKQKISDAAALQAKFLELNIETLSDMEPDGVVRTTRVTHKPITAEKIITKQIKWVDRFKSIADKFALDVDKSERDAKIDIKQDKVDVSDIVL